MMLLLYYKKKKVLTIQYLLHRAHLPQRLIRCLGFGLEPPSKKRAIELCRSGRMFLQLLLKQLFWRRS